MKKCLLYVLSFAVLSIGLFISFSDDTHAWTGDLPQCTDVFSGWQQMVENYPAFMAAAVTEFYEQHNVDLLSSDTSFIVFSSSGTGSSFAITATEKPYRFVIHEQTPSNERTLRVYSDDTHTTRSSERYYWSSNISTINNNYNNDYTFNENMQFAGGIGFVAHGGSVTNLDPSCIYTLKNVEYHDDYDGVIYDPFDESELNNDENPPDCGVMDFGCWLTGLVDTIGGTIDGAITAVVKAITWLFTPDPGSFQASFDELMDFFSDKLGFLFYPFELMETVYNSLVNADNGSSTMLGTYCLPGASFYGSNYCIRIAGHSNSLLYAIRPLLQGLIALALIQGFRNKYKEVVHK